MSAEKLSSPSISLTPSDASVLIVGGGVFGTSTAYHLLKRGYKNVTVLDRFNAPSKDSAATDLNKAVRADYPNPLYAKLALEALKEWKDPESIFAGMYHETGWIMGGHDMTRTWLTSAFETAQKVGLPGVKFMEKDEVSKTWPALSGDMPDWTNLYSPHAGWAPSAKALLAMAQAAEKAGAKYVTGDAGYVRKLLYSDDKKTCTGVLTADGTVHTADKVIVASGANSATLIDLAKTECSAECLAIVVIKLEPEEIKEYQDIPIIDDFEQGMVFPPDENGLIKICSIRSLTNYKNSKIPGASVLHSLGDYPYDGTPNEVENELRDFLREVVPKLADRPFIHTKLCWDAVAADLNFRICPYPGVENVYVGTVGSTHGFKFLPVIGRYIADMLEDKLDPAYQELWAWKYGKVPADFKDPHPYPRRDIHDMTGWQRRHAPASDLPWTWSRN